MSGRCAEETVDRRGVVADYVARGTLTPAVIRELAARFGVGYSTIAHDARVVRCKTVRSITDPYKRKLAIGDWYSRVRSVGQEAREQGDYAPAVQALRLEGQALAALTDQVQISGPGGGPIEIVVDSAELRAEAARLRRCARGEEAP